ncbi:unnamed protein product [Orchesella dallaii]|uniref:BTB domain-containing protein n=1 Tax=Orchesella dallaii TaxID=48710 RepID=A0ABP1PIU8_9HEXA
MSQTGQRIFLLKEGKKEFLIPAQADKNKMTMSQSVLYDGERGSLKDFPGEIYDQTLLRAVLKNFDEASRGGGQVNQCKVEMWSTYDTFRETFKFVIALRLGDELRTGLVRTLANPTISVNGKLTATHFDSNALNPKIGQEFTISEMGFKEARSSYLLPAPRIIELLNKAKSGIALQLNFSIILEWKNSKFELPPKDLDVLNIMLKEKLFADCVIVASNEARVECHRSVLSAHSDVLHTMLKSGFEESKTGTIEMADMSEKAVISLISYLYENKLDTEGVPEEIAFELLHAARKYNISGLEKVMVKTLTNKPDNWFQIKNVLTLYFFTVNVEEYDTLCEKMISILKRKSKELRATPAYQELEDRNPKEALELAFKLAER